MIQKGRKCLCKKCDDCNFYVWFDLQETNNGLPTGLTKREQRCGLLVLIEEIPRVRGSIDGCQAAANESRNRVVEFGQAAVETLVQIKTNIPKLLG
jgi:hypothetical protein